MTNIVVQIDTKLDRVYKVVSGYSVNEYVDTGEWQIEAIIQEDSSELVNDEAIDPNHQPGSGYNSTIQIRKNIPSTVTSYLLFQREADAIKKARSQRDEALAKLKLAEEEIEMLKKQLEEMTESKEAMSNSYDYEHRQNEKLQEEIKKLKKSNRKFEEDIGKFRHHFGERDMRAALEESKG